MVAHHKVHQYLRLGLVNLLRLIEEQVLLVDRYHLSEFPRFRLNRSH